MYHVKVIIANTRHKTRRPDSRVVITLWRVLWAGIRVPVAIHTQHKSCMFFRDFFLFSYLLRVAQICVILHVRLFRYRESTARRWL